MKANRVLFFIIFSFVFVTGFKSYYLSYMNTAVVVKVIQDVKHKKPNTDWTQTKPATPLQTKDELKTGDKSVAVLKFLDGSTIRVRENTTIRIFANKVGKGLKKNTEIDVGKMRFEVEQQQEDDEFIITTPTAVATIRGTSGLVSVLEDGSTFLTVEEGVVEVKAKLGVGESGVVEAGRTSLITFEGEVNIENTSPELLNELKNSLRTNEKYIRVQTPQGTFRIYYLDFE